MATGESTDHTYYADGDIPWDTQTASISGKVFIFEDFGPTEGSNWVQSNGLSGAPRGGRDIATAITASVTAQFPFGATLGDTPKRFAEVTLKYRNVDKVFVITEVGTPQKSGTETKVQLKIRERFNAPSGGGSGSGS